MLQIDAGAAQLWRTDHARVMHVAQVNVGLLKAIGGKAAAPTFTAQSAKTKAEILKALGDSYDYGMALIKEQTEATEDT
jgi:hypothetical protein